MVNGSQLVISWAKTSNLKNPRIARSKLSNLYSVSSALLQVLKGDELIQGCRQW